MLTSCIRKMRARNLSHQSSSSSDERPVACHMKKSQPVSAQYAYRCSHGISRLRKDDLLPEESVCLSFQPSKQCSHLYRSSNYAGLNGEYLTSALGCEVSTSSTSSASVMEAFVEVIPFSDQKPFILKSFRSKTSWRHQH